MNKFPVGAAVVQKSHVEDGRVYDVGDVIAVLTDGKLIVQWFEYDDTCHVQKHDPSELFSEEEATARRAEMDAQRSKLESEFETHRQELASKLAQATLLVKEAAAIAKSFDKDLSDMYQESRPLIRALNEAGWTPSSMRC